MCSSFFGYRVSVIVVLSVLLYSEKRNTKAKADRIIIRRSKPNLTHDVFPLMKTLGNNINHHIRLLYCPEYQEEHNILSSRLSGDLITLMSQMYEGFDTDLVPVLSPFPDERSVNLFTLCSTKKVLEIFGKISNQSLDSHKVKWLIVVEGSDGIESQFLLQLETMIYEGTQVTILVDKSNQNYDVFWDRVDLDGNISFFYEGSWNLSDSFVIDLMLDHLTLNIHRRLHYDLSGRRMIVAAKQLPVHFLFGQVYSDGSVEAASGLEVEILRVLSATMNFTYRVMPSKDNLYGNPQSDGSVNGIIGMVVRREATFAISILGISEVREKILDFTCSYNGGLLQLVSRAPKQKSRALAVLYPFSFQVWAAIATSVLFMGCCMFVHSTLPQQREVKNAERSGLEAHLFNVYRSIVVQGYRLSDQYWPTRFLLFSWFTFCLIVSASYSGMLTAVLALPSYETPIDSLHDLPRAIQDGYTLGVLKESTNKDLFQSAPGGILKRTWELFNHEDPSQSFVDGFNTGMQKVLERKFVFIIADKISDIIARSLGRRKFHFGREKFYKMNAAIACGRGAPFVERMSIKLLRLIEGGLIIEWESQELRKLEQLSSDSSYEDTLPNPPAFSLAHLQAAFIVMSIGFLVAALTFVLENVYFISSSSIKYHTSL